MWEDPTQKLVENLLNLKLYTYYGHTSKRTNKTNG